MDKEIIHINPKKVKPDPYQPRLKFERIKELGDSYDEFGQLNPIHIDANNILIDGERRLRAAILRKDKKIKAIQHSGITKIDERDAIRDTLAEHADLIGPVERAWNYARRVVKINTGEDYTPIELMAIKENDYEQLKTFLVGREARSEEGTQKRMGTAELARQLSKRSGNEVSQPTVLAHMRIIFLSQKFLDKIDNEELVFGYGREVSRLYKTPELMAKVEEEVLSHKLTKVSDTEDRVNQYLDELDKQSEELAEEIIEEETIEEEPEHENECLSEPEISKIVVETVAKKKVTRKRTSKPKKSPEEKAKSSLTGKGGVESKLEKAKDIGLDISGFEARFEVAVGMINTDPDLAWNEGKALKSELDEKIKLAEQPLEVQKQIAVAEKKAKKEANEKIKAVRKEANAKVREVKKKANAELMTELMADDDFRKQVAKSVKEANKKKAVKKKKPKKGISIQRPEFPPRHELIHGDCLEILKGIEEESIDVIVTSPPYNLNLSYGEYNDNRDHQEYLKWLYKVFKRLKRVLSKEGSFFLNVGFSLTNPWVSIDVANVARRLFQLQNNIVWVKSITVHDDSYGHYKPVNSPRFMHNSSESIFHFTKSGNVSIDRLAIGVPYKYECNIGRGITGEELRCRGNVWFIPYETIQDKEEREGHPSPFPPKLPEMCIKLHGIEKIRKVLDPFVGIGNTILAANELGIDSIGIDIDEGYVKITKRRLGAIDIEE